jgi:endonuclease/exonuclease/phosphatase family metal-dependent hydrolase
LDYADSIPPGLDSGHIAQIGVLERNATAASPAWIFGIANTHLKWDPPDAPQNSQYGIRQMRQRLAALPGLAPECRAWIICGDFNAEPDSAPVAALRAAGFEHSLAGVAGAATCNANRRAQLVDYIFYNAALSASPIGAPRVADDTPLPLSIDEPSDHVAVAALCRPRDALSPNII